MMSLPPIARALEAELMTAGDVVVVPAAVLRALLADYEDAADARDRLQGYERRLSQMVTTATSWAEVDG